MTECEPSVSTFLWNIGQRPTFDILKIMLDWGNMLLKSNSTHFSI